MTSNTALQQWALPQLRELLPLEDTELEQAIAYAASLPDSESATHWTSILGDSPHAVDFAASFNSHKAKTAAMSQPAMDEKKAGFSHDAASNGAVNEKVAQHPPLASSSSTTDQPPAYAPPPGAPPGAKGRAPKPHTNQVVEAARIRAHDEQDMQQRLQSLQLQYGIYNSDIEPEHETENYCNCAIHQYKRLKWNRYGVQKMWSKAVMYPGEKAYDDNTMNGSIGVFSSNPYRWRVVSPYGYFQNGANAWGRMVQKPIPGYHAQAVHQTIDLNNSLNREAQASIDAKEPKHSIWGEETEIINATMQKMNLSDEKRRSIAPDSTLKAPESSSRFSSFRKSIGLKSSDERTVGKLTKAVARTTELRDMILAEEQGRWQDEQTRWLVEGYQQHMGMFNKIQHLRAKYPIQYLHLLRAGYFEPIPVAWAAVNSNPLKFSIESAAGWRGITPAWRGYEDTAEERLYWVLNHREGSVGMRMKPDQISEMNMARARMATAVEPPPLYFAANDQCHLQHTSSGYSKQVMPSPFRAYDRPETATDDTMILLDVSGSMDFKPLRPYYDQYLITHYEPSTQPKNKDVAKAIIRRFTEAMENHDHQFKGYDFTTFSSSANYIGCINHGNFDQMYRNVRIGGGTRVMTGWQKVKDLHFKKHSASAVHHPVFGWQAGPETPMLRLLLLLDGEATDMDEFELDLLGLSWAHVTIFLIGVDGCPHHHRHANELQRISDVNHHVSFVDAQGNCPERFVTHELLKRHLGYEISYQEFQGMEELPAYSE